MHVSLALTIIGGVPRPVVQTQREPGLGLVAIMVTRGGDVRRALVVVHQQRKLFLPLVPPTLDVGRHATRVELPEQVTCLV